MMRSALWFLVLVSACGSRATTSTTGSGTPGGDPGLVAFETSGDTPLQGDDSRPHLQNVQRGPDGRGMVGARCTTCHGPENPPAAYGASIPPGIASGWRMPKPDERLVFAGVAAGALCEQVKDPAHNGGKDMTALRAHLDDPLVVWGWSPGFGRAPVPVSRDAFLDAWTTWASAGAPCPK
jgi:hypothetical protein